MEQPNQNQPGKTPVSQGPASSVSETPKQVIFVALSEKCCLDNFRDEVYAGERLVRPSEAIRFDGNMRVESDPEKIAFIRKSGTYAARGIWEVKDMTTAIQTIQQMKLAKSANRTFEDNSITDERIDLKDTDAERIAVAMSPSGVAPGQPQGSGQ